MEGELKNRIRDRLLVDMDLSRDISDRELRGMIDECILNETKDSNLSLKEMVDLKASIFNTFRRLDILSEYLDREDITEIMVNGYNCIFIERNGRIEEGEYHFES